MSPEGVAITPDGLTAYVTSFVGDEVTPINTADDTAGTAIPIADDPRGIAITPDRVQLPARLDWLAADLAGADSPEDQQKPIDLGI